MNCPQCQKEIDSGMTLWTWQGEWYCSEGCVRDAQVSVWGPRR